MISAGLAAREDIGLGQQAAQNSVGSSRTHGDVNLVSLGGLQQFLAGLGREVSLNPKLLSPRGAAVGCNTARMCSLSAALTLAQFPSHPK